MSIAGRLSGMMIASRANCSCVVSSPPVANFAAALSVACLCSAGIGPLGISDSTVLSLGSDSRPPCGKSFSKNSLAFTDAPFGI
jgi:hypothetical protein